MLHKLKTAFGRIKVTLYNICSEDVSNNFDHMLKADRIGGYLIDVVRENTYFYQVYKEKYLRNSPLRGIK